VEKTKYNSTNFFGYQGWTLLAIHGQKRTDYQKWEGRRPWLLDFFLTPLGLECRKPAPWKYASTLKEVIYFKVLWCSNNRAQKSCSMLNERQYLKKTHNPKTKKNTPNKTKKPAPPPLIFNSKVRCSRSLLNYVKQNNKISASYFYCAK